MDRRRLEENWVSIRRFFGYLVFLGWFVWGLWLKMICWVFIEENVGSLISWVVNLSDVPILVVLVSFEDYPICCFLMMLIGVVIADFVADERE